MKYYLLGSEAVEAYQEGSLIDVVKLLRDKQGGLAYFEDLSDPSEVMRGMKGWDSYEDIGHDDHYLFTQLVTPTCFVVQLNEKSLDDVVTTTIPFVAANMPEVISYLEDVYGKKLTDDQKDVVHVRRLSRGVRAGGVAVEFIITESVVGCRESS